MKVDLHIHTDISDGSSDITEVLKTAKQKGLTHIAITNHDTVSGLKQAIVEGRKENIFVIPGIEISACSTDIKTKKVHVLGYGFDFDAVHIKEICEPLLERRTRNTIRQIDILIRNGYEISVEDVARIAVNATALYKQHIMAVLCAKGYTDRIYSDLYYKLFKNGGICEGDIDYIDAVAAVRAIKADRGIAVLAHPGQLDSWDIVEELCSAGLDGVEMIHPDHNEKDMLKSEGISARYGLKLTGGSDFHGHYGTCESCFGEYFAPESASILLNMSNITNSNLTQN